MAKKQFSNNPDQFRYRGRHYTSLGTLRIRGKLYFIVEEWGTRYKAFDKSVQEMRSIRIRKAGIKREMKLIQLAKMQNNNVPHVYDHWRDAQNEYLVQEWLEGYDLRHYLRQGKIGRPYFSARYSYDLVRGLVTGLNRLHKQSVFHGDIKPGNLIVAPPKRLVMIDFGAAWSGAQTKSRSNQMSWGYAAPEQCQEEPLIDHRADQFAVSVVLYEMLTGELPYEGLGGATISYSMPHSLVPPSKKNREVWGALDQVIIKGLNLDKNQRYDTSSAWLNAFNDAVPSDSLLSDIFSNFPVTELWQRTKTTITNRYFRSK